MLIPLILSGIIVFFTHALEAVTGFGCSVLAMPFVTALLGMRKGVMIITILAWILALYIAVSKRKMINLKQFFIICGFMTLGLPVGMYLFRSFDVFRLKRVLAVFIIIASAWQLVQRLVLKKRKIPPLPRGPGIVPYFAVLVAGGVVHGMFSTGGPLVVIYAARALPDKGQFRATLCLLWTALNTIIIAGYVIEGSVSTALAGNTGALIPFTIAGIFAGEKIHDKVNDFVFPVIVFSMLLITGFFMLFLSAPNAA
jgi:uncharacterized membrane protein YfcA